MCFSLIAGLAGKTLPALFTNTIAPMLAGTAFSAYGQHLNNRAEAQNAQARADARNQELTRTLLKNEGIARDSRDSFMDRLSQSTAPAMQQDQQAATEKRQQTIEDAVTPIGDEVSANAAPISGSAPTVVKSELAKRISEALGAGKEQAKALGTLGGYGDSWLNQSMADAEANRQLGVNSNLASGNMALLPAAQDFAEQKAYKPISPLGSALMGAGSVLGGMAGSRRAAPSRNYSTFLNTPGPW